MPTSPFQGSLLGLAQIGLRAKGPDYAASLLSRFYAGARCTPPPPPPPPPLLCWRPLEMQWSRCMAGRRRSFEQSVSGEPSSKASLEGLQAKRLWRAFKQSFSRESSSKASQTFLFLQLFASSFVFWQLA